jgi:putative transposase
MSSPLDAPPDSYTQRLFLHGLLKTKLDRFALLALFKAQHLLGLVLAKRLVEMRASDDPVLAAFAKAEAGALLVHVLREALDILGARLDKLPERRRPQYTPSQRFQILSLKNLAGLTQPETASLFRVAVGTIARWETVANPASQAVGARVTAVPPVRRYNDTVHHLVQTLAKLGFGGSRSLVQHLARAGWKMSKTTVARYLEERPLSPQPDASELTETPKRAVRARFPHHVWHLDLTEIQAFLRATSFSLAVVFDSASRMPLSWKLFGQKPSAAEMVAVVEAAFARHGTPRHLIVDKDGAFTAQTFRDRIEARRVSLRYCSAQNHRANSKLERFWRTLKHDLLRLRPPADILSRGDLEHDVRQALRYYAHHRPHQGLAGATPTEVYLGLDPLHLRAVQPPRGRCGDPATPCPVRIEYLDGDRRFPFLRQAA